MGRDAVTLRGKSNWVEWFSWIQVAAKDKDVLELLEGKPDFPFAKPRFSDARYSTAAYLGSEKNLACLGIRLPHEVNENPKPVDNFCYRKHPSLNEDPLTADVFRRAEILAEHRAEITSKVLKLFDQDLAESKAGQNEFKIAAKLLYDTVSPTIQHFIWEISDPRIIFKFLKEHYSVDNNKAQRLLYKEWNATTLQYCNFDAERFTATLVRVRNDFEDHGKVLTSTDLCRHMLNQLPTN